MREEYNGVGRIDAINLEEGGKRIAIEVSGKRLADSFKLEVEGHSIDLMFEPF